MTGPLRRTGRVSLLALSVVGASLIAAGLCQLRAQERLRSAAPFTVRQILVPSDRPDDWPPGNWIPQPRAEWEALLRENRPSAPAPDAAWVEVAEYSARLVEGSLRGGQFTMDVRNRTDEPQLLSLSPFALPASEIAWKNGRRAVVGTASGDPQSPANGEDSTSGTRLLIDRRADLLTGEWELAGRKLPQGVQFDLSLAPATVTTLKLTLPSGAVLESTTGDVVGPLPGEDSGWSLWSVNCGSATQTRLTIRPQSPLQNQRSVILAETDMSYAIREEGLQFRAEFNLEVLHAPISTLVFDLPADFELHSVTYGAETPLTWRKVGRSGDSQRVNVLLPDPLIGRRRPILLRGDAPGDFERSSRLPEIQLLRAILLRGQMHLQIAPPLQLLRFERDGYRQSEAVVSTPDVGETLTFRRNRADARLTVQIARAPLRINAAMVGRMSLEDGENTMTAQLRWTAEGGSTYSRRCRIASGWEVTNIRPLVPDAPPEVANFELLPQDDGTQLLEIEWLQALRTPETKSIEILLRQSAGTAMAPLQIPAVRPLDCQSVESVHSLEARGNDSIRLSEPATLRRIDETELPAFIDKFPLGRTIRDSNRRQRLLLLGTGDAASGEVQRETLDSTAEARILLRLDVSREQMTERVRIPVVPQERAVDRLRVYVSSSGPAITWRLLREDEPAVAVEVIPLEDQSRWKSSTGESLPEEGQLWDVRLPEPLTTPFELVAERSRNISTVAVPALFFVPDAQVSERVIELHASPEVDLDVTADGPQSMVTDAATGANGIGGSPMPQPLQIWRYSSVSDSLAVRLRPSESSEDQSRPAVLHLRSVFSGVRGGYDLHRAQYILNTHGNHGGFRFQLAAPAELVSVEINGKLVSVTRDSDNYAIRLPHSESDTATTVDVMYRSPAEQGLLWSRHTVPLPRGSATVLQMSWQAALPSELRPATEPDGLLLHEPLPVLSWTQRLFGPLGRDAHHEMFNPFLAKSWRAALNLQAPDQPVTIRPFSAAFFPAGHRVWTGTAPDLPAELTWTTWNRTQAFLAGWIGLGLCFLAGVILRTFRVSARAQIGAIAISVFFVLSLFLPPWLARITGGCLLGMVVSMLLPRRFLMQLKQRRAADDSPSVGSTVTLHRLPVTVLLVGLVLWLMGVLVETTSAQNGPVRSTSPRSRETLPGDAERIDVLIPVKPDGSRTPVVYVSGEALTRLHAGRRSDRPAAEVLIIASRYSGTVAEGTFGTLEADYRVAVVGTSEPAALLLPIRNAHLDGADACRVNGVSQEIVRDPQGRGLLVRLVPEPPRPPADPAPPAMPLTDESAQPVLLTGLPVSYFDVQLRFHPAVHPDQHGAQLQLRIPRVVQNKLELKIPAEARRAGVVESPGISHFDAGSSVLKASPGPTDMLRIGWSDGPQPIDPRPLPSATVMGAMTIHPTWLECRYQVRYEVSGGRVDFVEWQLPARFSIRSISSSEGPVTVIDGDADPAHRRLMIELPEPQTTGFSITAVLVQPITVRGGEVTFVVPELLRMRDQLLVSEVRNHLLGFNVPGGYDLQTVDSTENLATSITPEKYLELADWPGSRTKPQLAWRVEGPARFRFRLTERTAERTVWKNVTAAFGPRQLDLRWNAEVETRGVSVYRHQLQIDERLQLRSISVRQDDAERLIRYTRVGDRLELMLSGKSNGVQNIRIEAQLPLAMSETMTLPHIGFENAEVAEARLAVYREAGVAVQLTDPGGLEPEAGVDVPADIRSGEVLVGRYRDADNARPRFRWWATQTLAPYQTVTRLVRDGVGWRNYVTLRFPGRIPLAEEIVCHVPDDFLLDGITVRNIDRAPPAAAEETVKPPSNPPSDTDTDTDADTDDATDTDADTTGADTASPVAEDVNSATETVTANGVSVTRRRLSDQLSEMVFTVQRPVDDAIEISFPGSLLAPDALTAGLPTVEAIDWPAGTHFLVIPQSAGFRPDEESSSLLPAGQVPEWVVPDLADNASAEVGDDTPLVFAHSSLDWQLSPITRALPVGRARVPLLQTTVWIPDTAPHVEYGSTVAVYLPRRLDDLQFSWPEGTEVRAIFVNRRLIGNHHHERNILSVPVESASAPQVVLIEWLRLFEGDPGLAGRFAQVYPRPLSLPIHRSIHTVIPPHGMSLRPGSGNRLLSSLAIQHDRLEGYLEAIRLVPEESPTVLDEALQRLAEELAELSDAGETLEVAPSETEDPPVLDESDDPMATPDAPAAAEVTEGAIPFPLTADRLVDLPRAGIREPVTLGATAETATTVPVTFRFWFWERWLLRVVAALAVVLIIVPIALKLLTLPVGDWLHTHYYLSWVILGLIWWVCLAPSIFGVALIVVAGIAAIRERRRIAQRSRVRSEVIID